MTKLKPLIILAILTLVLIGSGCTEKYTSETNVDTYIQFDSSDNTVLIHGLGDADFRGEYEEDAQGYSLFMDDKSRLRYDRFENGSIALRPDHKIMYRK